MLNDQMKQTGKGKQKQLTEFQNMCLCFTRAAKGKIHTQQVGILVPENFCCKI